jgi:hypothetical protein
VIRRIVGGVLTALTVAALGAAAGGWLGWQFHGPLIGSTDAKAVVANVVPPSSPLRIERQNYNFRYAHSGQAPRIFIGDDDYESGYVDVTAPSAAMSFSAVRTSLTASGWQVTDDPFETGVSARRGAVVLSVTTACGSSVSRG